MSVEKNLGLAAGLAGVFGLAAWAFYIHAFAGERGEDWMVYDTAIRAFYDGNIAVLYDGDGLTQLLNANFAAWLAHPLPLHPWLYPPHYLLLLLPFGLLPFLPAGILFLALSFLGLIAATCCCVRAPRAGDSRRGGGALPRQRDHGLSRPEYFSHLRADDGRLRPAAAPAGAGGRAFGRAHL